MKVRTPILAAAKNLADESLTLGPFISIDIISMINLRAPAGHSSSSKGTRCLNPPTPVRIFACHSIKVCSALNDGEQKKSLADITYDTEKRQIFV